MQLLVALGAVVAVTAAVRGVWSPCGLSMLSTITPLAEAGRGYRYRTTARWFVAGGVVGGAVTGAVSAGLAALVGRFEPSAGMVLGTAAVLALTAGALDGEVFGRVIPVHKRQVNDRWLARYRAWVYGGGFGLQIGTGFATYIMTAGNFLLVGLAALTGSPATAFGLWVLFGFVRGMAILLGKGITSPAALASCHAAIDRWREPVRLGTAAVLLAVAVVAATAAWGVAAGAVAVVLSGAVGAVALSPARRDRRGAVDVAPSVPVPA